jgi:hypothetical protein
VHVAGDTFGVKVASLSDASICAIDCTGAAHLQKYQCLTDVFARYISTNVGVGAKAADEDQSVGG